MEKLGINTSWKSNILCKPLLHNYLTWIGSNSKMLTMRRSNSLAYIHVYFSQENEPSTRTCTFFCIGYSDFKSA